MYELPKLSYKFSDLEPYIDAHTMGLHYHKHEQKYLTNLNELLIKNNYNFKYNINELIYHINDFPTPLHEDILFNLGGVLNHNLYWKSISPNGTMPSGNLKDELNKTFGSYENFWNLFKDQALKLKGSGYTFLVIKNNGNLDIINMSNQEIPISFGYIPLFNIDMWEHAYYLNYKNEKINYIENLKNIADFTNANKIYNSIMNY